MSGWPSGAAYEQWHAHLLQLLKEQHKGIIEMANGSLFAALDSEYVESDVFPSVDNEGELLGDGFIDSMELHEDRIENLGPEAILVPATLRVSDALVRLTVPVDNLGTDAAEYFAISEPEEGEHYTVADVYVELLLKADLRIDLGHDLESESMDEFDIEGVVIDDVSNVQVMNPLSYRRHGARSQTQLFRRKRKAREM